MSLLSIFTSMVLLATPTWFTHFEDAQKVAIEKNRYILVSFSGSDWCAPCIRTKKEIFQSEAFATYSENNLILVNADFPRSKKNQPDAVQLKENEALAEKYNPNGVFPLTILLDPQGKVIRTWEGFPNVSAGEFVNQIKATHASAH